MAESIDVVGIVGKMQNNIFNAQFAGRMTEEYLDPTLIWDREGFLTKMVPSPEKDIIGPPRRGSSGTVSSSGLSAFKVKPPIHEPGTLYPSVDIEGYYVDHYTTYEYGYKLKFGEDVQDGKPGSIRHVTDAYKDVGRWLGEFLNWEVLNSSLNAFTYTAGTEFTTYMKHATAAAGYETTYGFICGKLDTGYYWNTDSADYITDIEDMKVSFQKQTGYNYQLNRMYMDSTLMEKIRLWLYDNGKSWEEDPSGGGINRDMMRYAGVEMIGLNDVDGLTSTHYDKVILQDSRYTPCTSYYLTTTYDGFSRWGENSKVQAKSFKSNEETNDREVLFRTSQVTYIEPQYKKAYGFFEVY